MRAVVCLFSLHTISGGSEAHGRACERATGAPCGYPGSHANHGAEVRRRQRACEAAVLVRYAYVRIAVSCQLPGPKRTRGALNKTRHTLHACHEVERPTAARDGSSIIASRSGFPDHDIPQLR